MKSVEQCGGALAVLGQPLLVLQPLLDQRAQQPAQEEQLGTRDGAQPDMGVPGELDFPRVDDHQLRFLAGGLLDRDAHHVLLFGQIGVEHQDGPGLGQVPYGIGGGRNAQGVFQLQHQFRVGVGGMVHIVGTHHGPGELLGQIMFLVGAGGGREERKGLAGVPGQPGRDVVQRLVPRGLLEQTVPAQQGSAQAGGVVHVFQPEFSLETGLPAVRRGIDFGNRADQLIAVIELQIQLAAHGTVGADGALDPPRFLPLVVPFHQGAHRAYVNAGAAELASRLQQGGAEGCAYQGLAASFRERYRAVAPDLVAGPHAPAANDAEVVVPVIEWVGHLQWNLAVLVVQRGFQVHPQVADRILELTSLVLGTGDATVVYGHMAQADIAGSADVDAVAGQAAVGVLGDEHLHHRVSQLIHVGGRVAHPHPVLYRQGAGGGEAPLSLHRHHAHAAGGKGLHAGVITQVGDVDASVDGRFQDHLTRLCRHLYTIETDGYFIDHLSPVYAVGFPCVFQIRTGRQPRPCRSGLGINAGRAQESSGGRGRRPPGTSGPEYGSRTPCRNNGGPKPRG